MCHRESWTSSDATCPVVIFTRASGTWSTSNGFWPYVMMYSFMLLTSILSFDICALPSSSCNFSFVVLWHRSFMVSAYSPVTCQVINLWRRAPLLRVKPMTPPWLLASRFIDCSKAWSVGTELKPLLCDLRTTNPRASYARRLLAVSSLALSS